jgi:hypothetical protein
MHPSRGLDAGQSSNTRGDVSHEIECALASIFNESRACSGNDHALRVEAWIHASWAARLRRARPPRMRSNMATAA